MSKLSFQAKKSSQSTSVPGEVVTDIASLPDGWRVQVVDRGTKDRWIVLLGPDEQSAAFGCERGEYASPRSKVLDKFMEAAS
jgi:hypothetical protein